MSLITKNNYEAYLLDYVEENLSPELIAELMLFFENNPEFKEDLEAFEIHELLPTDIKLENKSSLIKTASLITECNYEDFLIAEIEGENTVEESHQLQLFVKENTNIEKELLAYKKTILVGEHVLFDNKKTLLQKEIKVIPLYWWVSAAAAVFVGFFLINGLNLEAEKEYFPIADRNKVIEDDNEKEDSLHFFIYEVDEQKLAKVEHKNSSQNKKSVIKKGIKKPIKKGFKEITPQQQDDKLLAETLPDTASNNLEELPIENSSNNDPELYAVNSVKIVYEDELLDNGTPTPEKKKITKLEIIRRVIKKQVTDKVLDKGRDGMLLAVNSKPASFIRGKK